MSQAWRSLEDPLHLKAWLSLSPLHQDFERFLEDLSAALAEAGASVPSWGGTPAQMGANLARTLSKARRPVTLFLDACEGEADERDAFLRALLAAREGEFRVVASARTRPSIGFAQFLARGEGAILSQTILGFNASESGELLKTCTLSDEHRRLVQDCRGWPGALGLVRASAEVGVFSQTPSQIWSQVVAYAGEETFAPLPARLREALVETAPLKQLSLQSFHAIYGVGDGQILFENLAQSCALLEPGLGDTLQRHPALAAILGGRFLALAPGERTNWCARAVSALASCEALSEAFEAAQAPHAGQDLRMRLEDAPPGAWLGAEALTIAARLGVHTNSIDFKQAPHLGLMEALSLYERGACDEADTAFRTALAALRVRAPGHAGGLHAGDEALAWEGVRAGLFEESITPAMARALRAFAGDRGLAALTVAACALNEQEALEACSASVQRGIKSDADLLNALGLAARALGSAAPRRARTLLACVHESARNLDRFAKPIALLQAWSASESGLAHARGKHHELGPEPLLWTAAPQLLHAAARLRADEAALEDGYATAQARLKEAYHFASARGWAKTAQAINAEFVSLALDKGADSQTEALIEAFAREKNRDEGLLAIMRTRLELARGAPAKARQALASIPPSPVRAARLQALLLEARVADALDQPVEADGKLAAFVHACEGDAPARLFFKAGGDCLWLRLSRLSQSLGAVTHSDAFIEVLAALALARPFFIGASPLPPPHRDDALLFETLQKCGSRSAAAKALKMSENTLKFRLKRAFKLWSVGDWRVAARVSAQLTEGPAPAGSRTGLAHPGVPASVA